MVEIEPGVFIAGQIAPADVVAAAALGVRAIVNNRPDGEERGQPAGRAIAATAAAAGLAYHAVPVAGGFAAEDVEAMRAALEGGPTLAYCKSGYRSAALWALARAAGGAEPGALIAAAARGGWPLGALLPALTALAGRGESGAG